MILVRRLGGLILFGWVLWPATSSAQMHTLETDQIRLVYHRALQGFVAPHVLRSFENSMNYHRHLFGYEPSERVTVLLHDQSDYANAGATASPRNAVVVALGPFSYVYETTPANERINLIASHELVHVLAVDGSTGSDRFFRGLFGGKVRETEEQPLSLLYGYLTTPRRDAPRWYHEGVAVFMETWMAGGIGRSQGAYDEMVFRAKVRDSTHFYDPIGLESEGTKIDFQGGVNSYLYGTRFMSYLAFTYSPERVIEWVRRKSGSKAYFGAQFKSVFGVGLDRAWSDWVHFERGFQRTNLDSVTQYPTTPSRDLSDEPLGSVSRPIYDSATGEIYVAVHFPGQLAHIRAIDAVTGKWRTICDVKGSAVYYVTSLAFDPGSRTLFYTIDNYEWRSVRTVNVATGRQRTLLKRERIGDLAFNRADSSLWGMRHFGGISTLVRIPYPYTEWNQLYSFPYGQDFYDLDLSADGRWLSASRAEISGRQTLVLASTDSLLARRVDLRELHDFGTSIPESFSFSRDGRHLYGSSYYTGVSNVFRYDLERDSMEAVTNAEVGYFRPLEAWSDSLLVLRFTGEGFVPSLIKDTTREDVSAVTFLGQQVAEKYPVIESWKLDPPSRVNLDSLAVDSGAYRPIAHVGLASLYPVVEGYKDFVAAGMRAELSDPIMSHRAELTLAYTANTTLPASERFNLKTSWAHRYWTLSYAHNGTDFYDLFGPARRSRRGNAGSIAYERQVIRDEPRTMSYTVTAAGYSDLEELPFFQDVPTSYTRFATLGLNLRYSNEQAALGAIDATSGVSWQFISYNQFVKDRVYAMAVNNLDLGTPVPLRHSSLWLRTSMGASTGAHDDPQANHFFGGFHNNYVDHQTEKRYRKHFTFPGREISSIAGTDYVKGLVEWNLPPWRFARMGRGFLHGERVRMALFGSALVTNPDFVPLRRILYNAGAQLDFRFMLLWHYRMTFSVGYASAFEKNQPRSDGWMWSLKIL